jgi:hypothetical protein
VTNPLSTTLRRAAGAVAAALRLAPLEVAIALGLAGAAMAAIHDDGGDEWFPRVAAAAALSYPLVLALSAAAIRGAVSAAVRWGGSLAVLAAAGLYAAFVLDPDQGAEALRLLCLVGVSLCALALVPRLWRQGDGRDRRRLWRFNAALLVRAATSLLYGGALMASLAGALAAVNGLFELDLPGELFGDLAAAIFLALVPTLVAGGLDDLTAEPPAEEGTPLLVRVLGRWLYALVVVLYVAILVVYCLKVVATGDLPKNLLSPLVLFAGFFGLVGAVYLDPVHGDGENRFVSGVARGFPAVLLLLVPVAVWAVRVRLGEHGWTEFRYLRMAALLSLALLGVLGTLRLVRGRPPLLAAVPLTLGVAALLSSVGPWSAQAVSLRDQRGRLERALHDAGLGRRGLPVVLSDSVPEGAPVIPAATYDRLHGAIIYLADSHGPAGLAGLITAPDTLASWEVAQRLPVVRGCDAEEYMVGGGAITMDLDESRGIDVPAGALHVFQDLHRGGRQTRGSLEATLDSLGRLAVRDTAAGWAASVDLAPLAVQHAARRSDCDPRGPVRTPARAERALAAGDARRTLTDASGETRGTLVLRRVTVVSGMRDSAGRRPYEVGGTSFVVVLAP